MALTNKDGGFNCFGELIISSLTQIANAERRLKAKKRQIEDLENELDLLENQALRTYKSNIIYLQLGQKGIIDKCIKWLDMSKKGVDAEGNKLDKRKKYEEKEIFEYYSGIIQGLLEIDIKITNIINFNFGQAYEIEFIAMDHTWRLEVPMLDNINLKTYKTYGASCFKLKITHEDNDILWSWIGDTYEEEKLKDIMQEGLEKYGLK